MSSFSTPSSGASSGQATALKGRNAVNCSPQSQRQHFFDTSLFVLDNTVENTLSQPYQPALPNTRNSGYNGIKHGSFPSDSPSLPHYSLSPSSATASTPDDRENYQIFGDVSTANGYLDPRSSHSPVTSGYSGSTTPGFDTLDEIELPPDADVPMYGIETVTSVNPLEDHTSLRNSMGSNGYPPSPRLTVSPHPPQQGFAPVNSSPVVKIERSTPEPGMSYPHPSPYSHHNHSNSSSSSIIGDNLTIRRGSDGNWRGGLGPADRGDEFLPFSLKEQELDRRKQEKNAEVEEWLKRSAEQLPRQNTQNAGGLSAPAIGRRRARSLADFRASQVFVDGKPVGPGESSSGNATGVLIDEDESYDYEDDSSVESGFREGSLDDPLDKELPPTEEDLKNAEHEEREREQRERERDEANLPNPNRFFSRHPWNDIVAPVSRGVSMIRNQPQTANAAMARMIRCAENIETASRVATFGSNMTKGRRNSTGDAEKVLGGGLIKQLSFGRDKEKKNGPAPNRKSSIWGGLKRSLSNSGGKRDSMSNDEKLRGSSYATMTSSQSPFAPRKLVGGPFGSTSSSGLKVETNVRSAIAGMVSPLAATGAARGSHTRATTTSPKQPSTLSEVFNTVTRNRSKSELHKKHIFGVVSSLVGPALPMTPPSKGPETHSGILEKQFTFGENTQKNGIQAAHRLVSPINIPGHGEDDDEDLDDEDLSPHGSRTPGGSKRQPPKLEITPTLDGFAQHVRTLTPELSSKLVDRIAHEQSKRFKKLVDHRHKHLAVLKASGQCSNGNKCLKTIGAIGVGSDRIVNVTGHKRGVSASFDGENVYDSSGENEDNSSLGDGNVAAAQFPPGVPTPPVSRLPAELECPICFKTKKFNKPSDWTKHVHEDVQPFTCTFPDCTEPKSFKRKADWVRHENERHRHLEWWTCNQPDCTHTCYRKDNFVQHLVREHKMTEPKVKAQKAKKAPEAPGMQAEINRVWEIVEACHQETDQHPSEERCRFCGNACSTWKKLTVHLARHMEAISLPVLDLIKDDAIVPISSRGPRRAAAQSQPKPTQQRTDQHQQGPIPLPMAMDIEHQTDAGLRNHGSPDGDYETDNSAGMTQYTPQRPAGQIAPTYTLTPPQHHQRSHSVPNDAFDPAGHFLAQGTGMVNGLAVSTPTNLAQGSYHSSPGGGYQYTGVNSYVHKLPQVYNNQQGMPIDFDQTAPLYPNYQNQANNSYINCGYLPPSGPPQTSYPMMDNQSMHAIRNRETANNTMGTYLASQNNGDIDYGYAT